METAAPVLATADIASLPTATLEEGICSFAARLAAASCVLLTAIAEYDRREAWQAWECRSMAHWLTWKCAMSPGSAREHVRVGAALTGLPHTRERFATGALSYSQVRALTRVATPATEAELVAMARAMTAAQLETVVRAYRRARLSVVDSEHAARARRYLTWGYDEDGSVVGRFRLPPEDGAVLRKAIELASESLRADHAETTDTHTSTEPSPDPYAATTADALVEVAGGFLAQQADAARRSGGEEGESGEVGAGEVDDRFLVTIIAERHVLEAPPDDPVEGVSQVEGGPGLAPSSVRRIACDQPTVTVTEDQRGTLLDVGRRTRRVNRALRRALGLRDGGCRYPGCRTRRSQAHHITHWIDGGATRLDNLISLCARHHHRHHEGAYRITPDPGGGWCFTLADGRAVPAVTTPVEWTGTPDPGVEPTVATSQPDWDGGRLHDLPWVIDGLLRLEGILTDPPPPPPFPETGPPPPTTPTGILHRPDHHEEARWPSPWQPAWDPMTPWPGE